MLRGAYGVVMLLFPGRVVAAYSGHPARRGDLRVARVLGARHVVQAIACAGTPTRAVLLLGAETDVAHAASALGLAALDRPRRRAGLVDAVVATLFAIAGVVDAARAPRDPPRHSSDRLGGLRDRVGGALAARLLPARVLRANRPSIESVLPRLDSNQ